MSALIINETIKLFSRKKTFIVLGLFVLLCLAQFLIMLDQEKYSPYNRDQMIEQVEMEVQWATDSLNGVLADSSMSQTDRNALAAKMRLQLEETVKRRDQLKAITDPAEFRRQVINDQYDSLIVESYSKDPRAVAYQDKLNSIYKENRALGVSPFKVELNGMRYLFDLSSILKVFLMIGLALFGADLISGEMTPPTFKHLLPQPIKRYKVWLSKFLVFFLFALILILGTELIFTGIVSVTHGFGELGEKVWVDAKPIKIQEGPGYSYILDAASGRLITMGQFIIEYLLMQSLAIGACVAFTMLVSTFLKSPMVATVIPIGISIFFLIFSNIFPSSVAKYLPYMFLTYQSPAELFLGSGNMMNSLNYLGLSTTFLTAVGSLLVTILVFSAVGLVNFKRKDILS